MGRFSSALRNRLLPAILTALGVSLVAGGLLTYTGAAGLDSPSASPTALAVAPSPTLGLPTFPPGFGSPSPSTSPTAVANRVATRVVIQSLQIDLPVIRQPDRDYPSCNVAMYFEWPGLGQPGQGVSTYLYAHARTGMFLPLLDASKRNKGKSLINEAVRVYTDDNQMFLYYITEIRPKVPADENFLDDPLAVTGETLWLQTSTGPGEAFPKLQVVALPLTTGVPASPEEAKPRAHPVDCS